MGRTKAVPVRFISHDTLFVPKKKKKSKPLTPNKTCGICPPNKMNNDNYLGDVWLGTSNNVLPEEWHKCKVSFINNDTLYLKMEFDLSTIVLIEVSDDENFMKSLFTSRIFAMKFNNKDSKFFAELYISEFPLPKFNKTISKVVQMVFARIFNIEFYETDTHIKKKKINTEEIDDLYQHISSIQKQNLKLPNYVHHPYLKPQLRSYQMDAVSWMKMKEESLNISESLHPLYQEIILTTKKCIYYSKYLGYIDDQKPLVSSIQTGGILADEMGLGKTVEVLACILSNPMNSDQFLENCTYQRTDASPVINKQPKKREREPSCSNLCNNEEDKPKKLKIPNDWIKTSSKKSSTRVALEMWYQNTLEEMAIKPAPRRNQKHVQCVCGDCDTDGSIVCVSCLKYQHAICMGYKTSYGEYKCPKCWMGEPLLQSNATLIICPMSLQSQWCEEICKHVGANMKVLVYEGSKAAPIYPTKLKEYDLVLTTYQVLQAELRLTESSQPLTLRREQRYLPPGCPITLIKWWRLCIDEAQTVEVSTDMISVMAKKIYACHRWAVTGTPITRDISGLYGLIDYLQLAPHNDLDVWNNLLYYPYLSGDREPMHKYLADIMWRSAKNNVVSQINIPKQTMNEYIIEFSAVEKYYYQREHELCTNLFLDKLEGYNKDMLLSSIDRNSMKKLMAPLLSIRQACNHPNTVGGRYLGTNKSVTSMEGLLDALIEKNITDSEENLRIVVSALNGLAGIYLLLQNPLEAVARYRQVLQLETRFNCDDNKKNVTVDKLQLIHTMHNLSEIIKSYPNIPPTLRDDRLRQDCLNLQKKYMDKYVTQSIQSYIETDTAKNTLLRLEGRYVLDPGEWYTRLTHWVMENYLEDDLQSRISSLLEKENSNSRKLNNLQGLQLLYKVGTWDQDLTTVRKVTIERLNQIYEYFPQHKNKLEINEKLIYDAMECHLRPEKKNKVKKCAMCNVSVQMRKYESVLFDMEKNSEIDISNKGTWKPTPQELVLKALYNLGKHKGVDEGCLKDGELYFRILELKKKEFKQMRKFWTHLDQQTCAHDEINMCKIRLSLRTGREQENKDSVSRADRILKQLSLVLENKLQYINFVEEHELHYQVSVLKNEERMNMVSLERNLGIHSYLDTLRRQQYAGQSPDPCPICQNPLQEHWSILPCGHCYCLECIQILFEKSCHKRISCSVCRQLQKMEDVAYIRTDTLENQVEEIKLKGNYSIKIESVVKLILKLRSETSDVKILVFSTWVEILKVMKAALTSNDVQTELMLSHTLHRSLTRFKQGNVTALLLPISLGSKGLNLIEATHVILTEPLLNPADELQAIGRIHRIGQTKPTMVHKFIVKNTIEESLHLATSKNANNWDKNKVSLQQLHTLFIDTSVDQPTVNIDDENNLQISTQNDETIGSCSYENSGTRQTCNTENDSLNLSCDQQSSHDYTLPNITVDSTEHLSITNAGEDIFRTTNHHDKIISNPSPENSENEQTFITEVEDSNLVCNKSC